MASVHPRANRKRPPAAVRRHKKRHSGRRRRCATTDATAPAEGSAWSSPGSQRGHRARYRVAYRASSARHASKIGLHRPSIRLSPNTSPDSAGSRSTRVGQHCFHTMIAMSTTFHAFSQGIETPRCRPIPRSAGSSQLALERRNLVARWTESSLSSGWFEETLSFRQPCAVAGTTQIYSFLGRTV